MVRWVLTCDDLEAAGLYETRHCCGGCHESNDEYGSDIMTEEPPPNGLRRDKQVVLYYCCGVGGGMTWRGVPLTRATFAAALWAYRAQAWLDAQEPA